MNKLKQFSPVEDAPSNQIRIECARTGRRASWINAVREGWTWERVANRTLFYSPEQAEKEVSV